MPGLDRKWIEYRLLIKEAFKPYKQPPRRMAPDIIPKVKEEVERLLRARFIRPTRYFEFSIIVYFSFSL